jgi:hypothetical protein
MSERERLPNRRAAEKFAFDYGAQKLIATVSRFPDGRVAEIFLNASKGSNVADLASESAIVASLALQHGCDIATIQHSIESTGAGPLSAALDLIDGGAP